MVSRNKIFKYNVQHIIKKNLYAKNNVEKHKVIDLHKNK